MALTPRNVVNLKLYSFRPRPPIAGHLGLAGCTFYPVYRSAPSIRFHMLIYRPYIGLYTYHIYPYIIIYPRPIGPSSIPGLGRGRMCEKFLQLLAVGRWFPPGTPVSSTRKWGGGGGREVGGREVGWRI